ncbi:related to 5`-3` exonuclease [Phialocephala subalpina]|uniref:Related to 5`-3` exonuclease n=1 Tax=Phialocephala subalpina TaxID=576137 RepID=A0A1L7XGM2_9HELO|nr:related to 5`-3` exonuclease [Phialocephala subalpina]
MGINGLLPLLKSIQKQCSLKKFEGKTLAVDAYGWLHRGTVSCAIDLAMGKPTKKFVDFAMHRVRMLQHFGVTPFLIFDGDYLPSKAKTEDERNKRREDSKKAGLELLNAGKPSQAYLEFQKAVDVTPEMARQLIDELKKAGVQYIVAPYEADAQMVYLERKGIVDGILSEDSDLLVFGAKCLLTKLDQYGNCIEVNKADFCACKEITLTGWSDKEFRQMAILSGCDYLSSISNMGLKTAYRMVRKHKTIEKVIRMLQFDGKFLVPKGYLEAFYQAEFTFLYQRVFCPQKLALVLHTQPEQPIDEDKMPYIGAYVEPETAQGVARGDLNPMTKLPITGARNKAAGPITPWSSKSRTQPQRSVSSNAMKKKGNPIDDFFKPKREPLREMDPNCFTPSPRQQEPHGRIQGLPNPILLPRPYIERVNTEPLWPQSAPPPVRSHSVRQSRAPTISEPRPPKRTRLCEDIDATNSPSQKVELQSSRFFSSSAAEPSPTVARKIRNKRNRKQQDINIFSDDSVEDAMLSLPDVCTSVGQTPTTGKKVAVFREASVGAEPDETPVSSDSQGTVTSVASQEFATSLTSSMRTASPEQPPTPTDCSSAPHALEGLRSRYTFSATPSGPPKQTRAIQNLPNPSSIPSKQSKRPLAMKSNLPVPKASSMTSRTIPTALQRIGTKAMNRSNLPITPPITPVLAAKPRSPRRSLLSRIPFPEVASESPAKKIDPAMVPLPIPDDAENIALNTPTGSEDQIIHDSEGDDEAMSSYSGPEEGTAQLDLGRFMFTAFT